MPPLLFDLGLLISELSQMIPGEGQNSLDKSGIQVRARKSGAPPSVDEIAVASRQTPKGTENDFCYQRIGCLPRFRVRSERPVCLPDGVGCLENERHKLRVVIAGLIAQSCRRCDYLGELEEPACVKSAEELRLERTVLPIHVRTDGSFKGWRPLFLNLSLRVYN